MARCAKFELINDFGIIFPRKHNHCPHIAKFRKYERKPQGRIRKEGTYPSRNLQQYQLLIASFYDHVTPLNKAPYLVILSPSLRHFEELEKCCLLKASFLAKYVHLEINQQKHNVLRRKVRSIKIYGLENPAALQKTDFFGDKSREGAVPKPYFFRYNEEPQG